MSTNLAEETDRLRIAVDILQERGVVVDERHLAELLGLGAPAPDALAATCGTCGESVTAEGQWVLCREHYVRRIKELESQVAALVVADRVAALALRFQQAVETLESCQAQAMYDLPGQTLFSHEQVLRDAANTRAEVEGELTDLLETYTRLRNP